VNRVYFYACVEVALHSYLVDLLLALLTTATRIPSRLKMIASVSTRRLGVCGFDRAVGRERQCCCPGKSARHPLFIEITTLRMSFPSGTMVTDWVLPAVFTVRPAENPSAVTRA
jgi:hypothetical protein